MNWRKIEKSFETVGMLALVKGGIKGSDSSFYEVGRIGRLNDGLTLTSVTTTHKGIPATRIFDFNKCEYWYINIDEIK